MTDALSRKLSAARGRDDPVSAELSLERLRGRLFGRRVEPLMLARYILLERVSAGGAGIVYVAYDPELDRRVAIKVLRPSKAAAGRDGEHRLLREAQALARLSHPNIVAVHDVGVYERPRTGDEDRDVKIPHRGVFVVMELVDGWTLVDWQQQQAPAWHEVLDAYVGAGRGLAAAHAAGIVHRDFKPSNALMSRGGLVKVLDFGLARAASASSSSAGDGDAPDDRVVALDRPLTLDGTVLGTPLYMAPEQHRGEPVDERADQFSYCASLFQALYGRPPFSGESLEELAQAKTAGRVAEVPADARVPERIRRAVLRGLAASAHDRHRSMNALLAELTADPWAVRKRWLLTLAAIVTLGASVAGVAAWRRARAAACDGAEERLAGVWDASTRTAVRDAFTRTDVPYASDAVRTVTTQIDAYARGWVEQHRDACRATLLREEQSATVMNARIDCLEQRRGSLQELTRILAAADTEVIESAADMVGALPGLDECAQVQPLDEGGARMSASGRQQRLEVERTLARARSLTYTDRRAARELASNAADRAAATDEAQLQVRALTVLGRLTEKDEDAIAVLWRAAAIAERLDRTDLRDDALLEVVARMGVAAQHEQADHVLRLVQGSVERRGAPPAAAALLHHVRGLHLHGLGRWHESREAYQQALEIRMAQPNPRPQDLATAILRVGQATAELGEFAEARRYLEQALELREQVYGPEHPQTADVLHSLGAVIFGLGDLEAARDHYQRALEIRRPVLGEASVGNTLNDLGLVYGAMGDRERAIEYLRDAMRIRERNRGPEHPLVAQSLSNLAVQLSVLERHTEALEYAERSLDIRQRTLEPEHPDVASSLINVGVAQLGLGRHEDAIASYERALALLEPATGPDHPSVLDALEGLGIALVESGQFDAAVEPLRRAERLLAEGSSIGTRLINVRFGLARALVDRDRRAAIALARQALHETKRSDVLPDTAAAIDAWLAEHGEPVDDAN